MQINLWGLVWGIWRPLGRRTQQDDVHITKFSIDFFFYWFSILFLMWLKVAKKNFRKKNAIIKLVANCNCGQAIVDKFPKLNKIVFLWNAFSPNISLLKVNNSNTRKRCEVYSKLTLKKKSLILYFIPFSSVCIVDFEQANVSWVRATFCKNQAQLSKILFSVASWTLAFNPLQPSVAFLYPLKTSEDLKVFWCFQRVDVCRGHRKATAGCNGIIGRFEV